MKRNFINNDKKSVSRGYPKNHNGFTGNGFYLRYNRGPTELLDLLQNPDNKKNIIRFCCSEVNINIVF